MLDLSGAGPMIGQISANHLLSAVWMMPIGDARFCKEIVCKEKKTCLRMKK